MNPDAEKNLRAGLDAARDEYEEKLAGVRATYFSQIEMLHKKLASAQQAAVDVYHGEVRGELTDVLRKLRPLVDDEAMGAEVPTSMLKPNSIVSGLSAEEAMKWREALADYRNNGAQVLAAPAGEPDVRLAPPEASGFFVDDEAIASQVDAHIVVPGRLRSLFKATEPKPTPRHYG